MKAHTTEKKKIILSIGMIVKNEEKVLERCLKSLQPLMKAIPSELIIADTGSTDSTVEIAKRYTDNVFHFEWINDFAAARNSTLNRAKGQWYLFIDADEYFDDNISEIIDFFGIPELRKKFNTIELIVRSYTEPQKIEYLDAMLPRFFNISNNSRVFEGKVHEGILVESPLCYFSSILHHTGYMFNSNNQNFRKKMRNLELMKEEYAKDPNDLRMLSLLIDGTGFKSEESEKENYINKALEIAKNNTKHSYSKAIYLQAISYYKEIKPEYALELCDEYKEKLDRGNCCVASVGITLYKAIILSSLAKYNDAIKIFEEYFSLYQNYIDGKLNISDLEGHPIQGITEHEYIEYNCMAAIILGKMRQYNKAIDLLKKFDISALSITDYTNVLGTIREICQCSGQYYIMPEYYDSAIKSGDSNKTSLALYMMESTYYSIVGEDKRSKFARAIVDSGYNSFFCELMNLRISQNSNDFAGNLQSLINSIDDWKDGYSEAIYLALKNGLDISKAVDKMDPSSFREKLEMIAVHHDDFAGYVLNYGVPEEYTKNIKRFYWITSLYEKASYRSFELNDQNRYALYLKFVELLGEYVSNIYNSELLQDESDVQVLPPLHKFGFYMLQANTALLNGDSIGYIRGMKKALQNCESMKEIVEFMLEQFKKKIGMN